MWGDVADGGVQAHGVVVIDEASDEDLFGGKSLARAVEARDNHDVRQPVP